MSMDARPRYLSTQWAVPKHSCAFYRHSDPFAPPVLAAVNRPATSPNNTPLATRRSPAIRQTSARAALDDNGRGLSRTPQRGTSSFRQPHSGAAPAICGRDLFSSSSLWWAFFHPSRRGWITAGNRFCEATIVLLHIDRSDFHRLPWHHRTLATTTFPGLPARALLHPRDALGLLPGELLG